MLRESVEGAVKEAELVSLHASLGIPEGQHLGTLWTAAPLVGQGADALSTIIVLHTVKGSREGNPLVAPLLNKGVLGEVAFVGLKLGLGAGFAFAGAKLTSHGHRDLGRITAGVGGFLGVAAAISNVSLLRGR